MRRLNDQVVAVENVSVGSSKTIWLRPAHSRFTLNCGTRGIGMGADALSDVLRAAAKSSLCLQSPLTDQYR